ncbi:MAG: C4-type zinc ribbon domain-containing protein [Pseudomonadota bacterium]
MKEQMQLLVRLQEIDVQIDRYEGNLARLPLEAQEIAKNMLAVRREISDYREKLEGVEKIQRLKENDMAVEQEKIKRSEKRLLNIKNQKEYNALAREIKLGKKVVGEIEETVLECMTQTETYKKILDRKESDYAELEENLLKKKAEVDEATQEAMENLDALKGERPNVLETVDKHLLKRYELIRKNRGSGVAEVTGGSCTSCHMALPPQLNILVLKQETLIECPNCHRLLYILPENVPEHNTMPVSAE